MIVGLDTDTPTPLISLLTQRGDLERYVTQIQKVADGEKDAFGFLPAAAYTEFAYQGRIVIAVEAESQTLAGYTIFGGAMPQGRIFQTWTSSKYRGQGIGRKLIDQVVRILEDASYLSIRADVASDLETANSFYGELGFEVIRSRPGGKTRGRVINVRVRELSTPSLLEMATDKSYGLGSLVVGVPAKSRTPLYILDLNVLFDVTKQRLRAAAASRVMSAAFENDVRLSVTAEFVKELERHTTQGRTDPVLALAKTLPRLPLPPRSSWDAYLTELAPVVFPDRARDGKLTIQDRSDLMHLITAIHECAAGFVTSEGAILKAAGYLRGKYGLDVVSPETFAPDQGKELASGKNVVATSGEALIVAKPIAEADYGDVELFMQRAHATPSQIRAILSSGTATLPRRRLIVRANSRVCGVAAWDSAGMTALPRDLSVYIDEENDAALVCAEHLIRSASSDLGGSFPAILRMATPANQPTVRRAAINHGFFSADGEAPRSRMLTKIALGCVLTPDNWQACSEKIRLRSAICLPAVPPSFVSAVQPFELRDEKGKRAAPALSDVERLLSPFLAMLPGRPAVVLPITQAYAEELFQGSAQPLLLSAREAVLRSLRGYISSSATYSAIGEGALAVFYESATGGGRSAATAIARITRRYLMDKDSASQYATTKGVLEARVIRDMGGGEQVCVSEFDNLMLFRKPVFLSALRALGCADGANFVTARALSSVHLSAIVDAGEPHV